MTNPRERARSRQQKKPLVDIFHIGRILRIVANLLRREAEPVDPGFVIRRGEVYTSSQVINGFGIAKETLQEWMKQGLRSTMRGSRTRYFLGDQIIDFLFLGPAEQESVES